MVYFFEVDQFSTIRQKGQTIEQYRNVIQRRNSVHVFSTRTEETSYYHQYHDIPAYYGNGSIPFGLHNPIIIDAPDDVIKGAFYWKGPQDGSIRIEECRYNDTAVTLKLTILDDSIITTVCDSCLQDKVLIHLSPYSMIGNLIDTMSVKKDSIYTIALLPNSETPHISHMHIQGTITVLPIEYHTESNGYSMIATIPLMSIPFMDSSVPNKEKYIIGCTIEAIDIDNPFRPEEHSRIVTSDFEQGNSSTLGKLTFYPINTFDGELKSHITQQFVQTLQQLGF